MSISFITADQQQSTGVLASHIKPHHWDELVNGSAIDPAIAKANFQSKAGAPVLEWLTEPKLAQVGGHGQQYATAEVRRILNRIEPVAEGGGWQGQGLDPFNNWERMSFGCFKPDQPRYAWEKGKNGNWVQTGDLIKYEHPQGTPSRAFFCDFDPNDPEVGRYKWALVEKTKTIPIVIGEGLKKAACLMSHQFGYAAIGLPGVAMWNKPKTRELIAELELFADKDRVVYICFDQDSKRRTRRAVGKEISKLSSALKRHGCKVKVIQWDPALGKGVDDLIAGHGPEAFRQAYDHAVSADVVTVQRKSELSFTPNWVAPKGIKYLTDAGLVEAIPPDAKLVGIKGGKGTGKTEAMGKIVDQGREKGQRTLVAVHREQLAKTIGDRTGTLSIYEVVKEKGETKHHKLAEVMANGVSLCIHSCHPDSQAGFRGEDWENDIVVIDECTQVFWDVLNSSILKKTRVPILKELQALLSGVLSPETEGRLFLLDADLDNITINGVRGIAGQPKLTPWIAVSNYQEGGYNCHVHKNPQQWLMQAEQDLDDGLKLLVMTDSQEDTGSFSSTTLENRWNKRFPDRRILRVDSDSLKTKGSQAFGCIKNANNVFSQYDVVICSPSVETGISLDLKGHFNRVYGCYQGVLSENSVRQSLARLREPVDRVIYAATRGLETIGGGDTYGKALIENVAQKANAITGDLMSASVDDLGGDFLPSALEMWSEYAARNNAGMAAYRETIIAQLRAEGQTVTEEGDPDQDAKQAIAEVKAETKIEKHEQLAVRGVATCSAEPITDDAYEKRKESTDPQTEAQKLEMARKKLSNRYGAEPTLDLFMLDQDGWNEKIRLHYYLTIGRENLKGREKEKLSELVEASTGDGLWLPDVARSSKTLKVAALDWLDVLKLLDMAGTEQTIHKDHPLVTGILEKAQSNPKAIRLALGIKVTQKTRPVSLVRDLLSKVGFGLSKYGKIGPRGAQAHTYLVEQIDSKVFKLGSKNEPVNHEYSYSREAIFERWLAQDVAAAAAVKTEVVETTKTTEQQEVEPVGIENPVGISGNSISISSPNAYQNPPIEGQAGAVPESPSELTQIERVCLDVLQTCDCWGQYLSVQAQVGAQRVGQLWGMLTGQQQRSIRAMEPQGGMS